VKSLQRSIDISNYIKPCVPLYTYNRYPLAIPSLPITPMRQIVLCTTYYYYPSTNRSHWEIWLLDIYCQHAPFSWKRATLLFLHYRSHSIYSGTSCVINPLEPAPRDLTFTCSIATPTHFDRMTLGAYP